MARNKDLVGIVDESKKYQYPTLSPALNAAILQGMEATRVRPVQLGEHIVQRPTEFREKLEQAFNDDTSSNES